MRLLSPVALVSSLVLSTAALAAEPLPVALAPEKPAPREGPLSPPLDESPFAKGFPTARLPSRALVKLEGIDEPLLERARTSADAAAKLHAALVDVERRTELTLRFVRALSFGWAVYDVTERGSRARLDEAATLAAVERLAREERVRASDDRWMRPLRASNDPGNGYTWHYDSIGAASAWDVTVGTAEQRVGVVDTGTVRSHEDLSAKAVAGYDFISFNDISADGNGRDADYEDPGDGANCGQGYLPDSWHGSHVAGTILASTNNGRGIAGVNWNAKLVTGRALGRCGGANSDILEALAWMSGYIIDGVPNIGASDVVDVVNLSLGQDVPCSDIEDEYVSTILAQTDVVIVAAAGNAGNGVPVGSPANCPGVISVGAHGPSSSRALTSYSNWSSDLDIVAPGGDLGYGQEGGVLSACGEGNDCYAFEQGTSMASPHVAGAVALMRAANPTLSANTIRDILRSTGTSCTYCDGIPALRLDLAVAEAAQRPGGIGVNEPEPDPDPVDPDPVDPGTGDIDVGGGDQTDACDPRRGNWDCPNHFGCIERGGSALGICVAGIDGPTKSGGLCEEDEDCSSGLCDRGVCTVPCDDGCRDGYVCDEELIPGGICRPESCADSEGGICGGGWHCAFSPKNRYVCAAEGEDVFAPRGCATHKTRTGALPLLALVLGAVTWLARRRRARG